MSQYLILLRRPAPASNPPSADTFGKAMQLWGAFLGELGGSGKLRTTHQLEYEGVVTSADAEVTAIDQTRDTVIGWVVVEVDSIEEAIAIADRAPTLSLWPGGTAEVRPIKPAPQT